MGFINLELKRQMQQAEQSFDELHEAIFEIDEPKIPDGAKTLTPAQRSALEGFQAEAFRRVAAARKQALFAQNLAVEFHSNSGPLLYRRPRSRRAHLDWDKRIASLDGLTTMFGLIMGPYE